MAQETLEEEKDGLVRFTISMDSIDFRLLDRLAKEKRLTRSEFVRQCFGTYLRELGRKFIEPTAGVFVDASGAQCFVGLLSDEGRGKVSRGEWRCVKEF